MTDDARGFAMCPDRKFMYERLHTSEADRAKWEESGEVFVSPAIAEFNAPTEGAEEKWYSMNRSRVAASTHASESVRQYFNPKARSIKGEE